MKQHHFIVTFHARLREMCLSTNVFLNFPGLVFMKNQRVLKEQNVFKVRIYKEKTSKISIHNSHLQKNMIK